MAKSEIPFYQDDTFSLYIDISNKLPGKISHYDQICKSSYGKIHEVGFTLLKNKMTSAWAIYRNDKFIMDTNSIVFKISTLHRHFTFEMGIPYRINPVSSLFRNLIELVGKDDIPYIILGENGYNLVYRDSANVGLVSLVMDDISV
jgi:hypothetical protein